MEEQQGENPYGTTPESPEAPYGTTPESPEAPYGTTQATPEGPYGTTQATPEGPYGTTTAAPAGPPTPPWRRNKAKIAVAGTLALALGLGGFAIGDVIGNHSVSGSGTPAAGSSPIGQFNWGDQFGNGGSGDQGNGSSGLGDGGFGSGGSGGGGLGGGSNGNGNGTGGSGSGTGTGTTGQATQSQSVGVVDITTVIDYGQAEAAGTGIVLTSNGEILTNNHVVHGATKITATVVSTGRSYTANVVGTDATDDVAVLQLSNASGLSTAKLSSGSVSVGDAVTAVGNAGGTGGTPSAATGNVTGLDQSITASDESGANPEQLTGMIQVDADIQAGDSGGPLYNSQDEVVGIDTAANSGQSGSTVGFAIPIAKATSIADRIESGENSATIKHGTPAFLGVQLSQDTTGAATISGVVDGSPAAQAGLQAGDTITAVDGTTVDSAEVLSSALAKHNPGDQVRITWTDSTGSTHSATTTLVAGPAA